MISKRQKQRGFVRKPGEDRSCDGYSVAGKGGPYKVRIKPAMKYHQRHSANPFFSCRAILYHNLAGSRMHSCLWKNHLK